MCVFHIKWTLFYLAQYYKLGNKENKWNTVSAAGERDAVGSTKSMFLQGTLCLAWSQKSKVNEILKSILVKSHV